MTASRKISKSQTAMSVQEKRALDRAFKKMENTEGKFYPFTRAESDAYNAYEERNKKANTVTGLDSLIGKQYIAKVNITSEEEKFETVSLRISSELYDGLHGYNISGILEDYLVQVKATKAFQEAAAVQDTFLQRADKLIKGDRQKDYGNKLANFAHIAMFFQAVLAPKLQEGVHISPEEVGMMMQGVKMARMIKSPDHSDSVLDNAGYAGCIGELQAERLALKKPMGAITDSNSWMIPNVGS